MIFVIVMLVTKVLLFDVVEGAPVALINFLAVTLIDNTCQLHIRVSGFLDVVLNIVLVL